ncbi:acetaldehyde dehydrogenase (acetylating) [Amycolatopsis rhabdoformis]|uniref:Acetaldehyde dehydrogenase n=1 Tax=Amycolatopsis rhabdoformis TaxID=1448059 RepID=A0ABZ1IMJ5_9PSEU|nr:acetaldehyde dehydrogenase (acetylating) [Amycolatopsis rhabdoformis]WSE34759.1 acetaldehyde dehydrogenase (acetylating) [Amycolatopsis rhabdoformis]
MNGNRPVKVVIVGPGNIGTDLAYKVLRSPKLELAGMVGVDPASDGLRRMRDLGVRTTSNGVAAMGDWADLDEIVIAFDATSAGAHRANSGLLTGWGIRVIDLTPAAIGPMVVPAVNLDAHADAVNVNMVTCAGQATIPVVAAVSRVAAVEYAEIVASLSSRSAGPGTRANIDETTITTSKALEVVGGARIGKAFVILNPADPPVLMRDTVHCLVDDVDETAVRESIHEMVRAVSAYVPGYRLKHEIQVAPLGADVPLRGIDKSLESRARTQITTYLEVEGAADYLPAYAGNLDIMTAAALGTAERYASLTNTGATL